MILETLCDKLTCESSPTKPLSNLRLFSSRALKKDEKVPLLGTLQIIEVLR